MRAGLYAPRLHRASLTELQRSHTSISGVQHCASAGGQGHSMLLPGRAAIGTPPHGEMANCRRLGLWSIDHKLARLGHAHPHALPSGSQRSH